MAIKLNVLGLIIELFGIVKNFYMLLQKYALFKIRNGPEKRRMLLSHREIKFLTQWFVM